MEKTKGRGNKGGRALGDYLMFLRNERKNIFSPKYRNKKYSLPNTHSFSHYKCDL